MGSIFRSVRKPESQFQATVVVNLPYPGISRISNWVLGKEGNQSWQFSGLSSTSLQITVLHGEKIVLMTRNMKMRCEILLHFSLMDHYLLRTHSILAQGYIHYHVLRKLLDIPALRNFNGKKFCLEFRPSQGLSVSISSTS